MSFEIATLPYYRSLSRRGDWEPAASLFERLAEAPFATHPNFDWSETNEAYVLAVDMPGVRKDDIKIGLHDRLLSIQGERKTGKNELKLSRSFTIPDSVDGDKVQAKFEDGVLQLTLPKSEQSKP